MQPLIITVAAVGAELSKEEQPGLPVTPEELARDAEECAEAGAAIYHLHVRDSDGHPTMEVSAFRSALEAIHRRTDLVVQFTTGGAIGDPEEARVAPLALRPEMATLTTGSVNFGEEVFLNPLPLVRRIYEAIRAHGAMPEFEIFEPGMIATAERLYAERGESHHKHFDLVLGVPGALPAWDGIVSFLAGRIPRGATWSATGIGRSHLDVLHRTLEAGGHVRTGMEDVRYLEAGRSVASNRELVERVVRTGRDHRRVPATPEQAREILGLPTAS